MLNMVTNQKLISDFLNGWQRKANCLITSAVFIKFISNNLRGIRKKRKEKICNFMNSHPAMSIFTP